MSQMKRFETAKEILLQRLKAYLIVQCLQMKTSGGAEWSSCWSCAMCVITVTLIVHFGLWGPSGSLEIWVWAVYVGMEIGLHCFCGLMQAVVKLIKKLLMSSSSDINGLYCLSLMIWPSLLNKITYSGVRVKANTPHHHIRAVRQCFFISAPPGASYLTRPVMVQVTHLHTCYCVNAYICEDKKAGMWNGVVRCSVGPGRQRRGSRIFFFGRGLEVGMGGWREPCGSLEWCDRLRSLLVGFVGMWERRILAPGEPRQSAADFMPSVSASILSLPNSSDLYFLSLYLLLIPVHKSSRHTEIC